jgi:hypothetical protein
LCYYGRILASLPGRPEVVASACQTWNGVSISTDGGPTWETKNAGCQVRQISLVEGVIIASCFDQPSRSVEYDLF